MSSRKTRKSQQESLDSLLESCNDDEVPVYRDEQVVTRIIFKNNETPLDVRRGRFIFNSRNADFNKCEFLIDSFQDWHKVSIFTQEKSATSQQILTELFRAVDNQFFVPIGYRSSKSNVSFYVLAQGAAMKKFFDRRLQLHVLGETLEMEIQICVEKVKAGHPNIEESVKKSILKSHYQTKTKSPNTLDLSFFKNKWPLADFKINLSNSAVLSLLLDELSKLTLTNDDIKSVTKLNLANNDIESLEPFTCDLEGLKLDELDLSFNRIDKLDDLKSLATHQLKSIRLIGNPVESELRYDFGQLQSILSTLVNIDKVTKLIIDSPKHQSELKHDNRNEKITNFIKEPKIIKPESVDDDLKQNFAQIYDNSKWSRVIVFHKDDYGKDDILDELTRMVNPHPFYPCYYTNEKRHDSFLIRANCAAMDVLIKSNLKLKIPPSNDTMGAELRMNIELNVAEFVEGQLDWARKLNYVIAERVRTGELNLRNFADDDSFGKIFISFGSRHLVNYVMTVARLIDENVDALDLSGNQITHIDESIPDIFTSIDLSENRLESLCNFSSSRLCAVQVHLSGNPLCKLYGEGNEAASKYLRDVKQIFPNLKRLDGLQIDPDVNIVAFQNFLISPKLYSFVEYFIKFYFDLYDDKSGKRAALKCLYSADAIFTHRTPEDDEAAKGKVFHGREAIKSHFELLPTTRHYFTQMNVDVPLSCNGKVLISICGIFEETNSCEMFDFTRNFMIMRTSKRFGLEAHELVITNDLLHTRKMNQKSNESEHANEDLRNEKINEAVCQDFAGQSSQDVKVLIDIIRAATKLKENKCEELLMDSSWDIKAAIENFNVSFDSGRYTSLHFDFDI